MLQLSFKRTRIAPTPSGFLHLGNIFSFAVTVAMARKTKAKILLRIDDLDQLRVNPVYVQDIFNTLNFLQMPYDEGPKDVGEFEQEYSQNHRMERYEMVLQELADKQLVFACTCSRQQINSGTACTCYEKNLPLITANASWRLKTDDDTEIEFKNETGDIIKSVLPGEMKNFIVRKKDGFPAYQLTSLVDDLFYEVDLAVRGEDLRASTLAQHTLANVLGRGNKFGAITFYHHPLIMEKNGKKLSKSAGAASVKYLREKGLRAADVFTLIAEMVGIGSPVTSWEQLGEALTDQP